MDDSEFTIGPMRVFRMAEGGSLSEVDPSAIPTDEEIKARTNAAIVGLVEGVMTISLRALESILIHEVWATEVPRHRNDRPYLKRKKGRA